ncbi:MAG TPA: helix-turn-helix domain-containing protein [Planctomycetota bacterium]|jgi:excisionase family DNA binding protein
MSKKRSNDADWRFSRRDINRCGQDGKRLYLTLEDTAAHFGVSLHTVLQWCKVGALPEHRIGGRIYLNRDEVANYWALFGKKR